MYATDKVIALESAIIIGNIYATRLIAEEGVLIDAGLKVSGLGKPEARPVAGAGQPTKTPVRRSRWSRGAREGAAYGSDRT